MTHLEPYACPRRHGFTLVEVMMALAIMMIGGTALIAMQQTTARANREARQMTTAEHALASWIERLKRDAIQWNAAGQLANTTYLQNVDGLWRVPPQGAGESPAFDYFGRDIAPASPDVRFCVSYRLSWVYTGNVMRADVRAYWPRTASGADLATDFPSCGPDAQALLGPGNEAGNSYHKLYASTLLRRVPRAN